MPPPNEQEPQRLLRSTTAPAGLVQRARIVPRAAEGVSSTSIAAQVGDNRLTVISWRNRLKAGGIEGYMTKNDQAGPDRSTDWR